MDEFYNELPNSVIRKLITFANLCINYDAKERPSAIEIKLMMKPFKCSTEEEIIEGYVRIIENRGYDLDKKILKFMYEKNKEALNFLRNCKNQDSLVLPEVTAKINPIS